MDILDSAAEVRKQLYEYRGQLAAELEKNKELRHQIDNYKGQLEVELEAVKKLRAGINELNTVIIDLERSKKEAIERSNEQESSANYWHTQYLNKCKEFVDYRQKFPSGTVHSLINRRINILEDLVIDFMLIMGETDKGLDGKLEKAYEKWRKLNNEGQV